MSIPPDPPPSEPDQPPVDTTNRSRKAPLQGALVATVVVVLISLLFGFSNAFDGLVLAPLLALGCVLLGSILTVFERTRRFAVGFLITSAILILVTAGVCAVALSSNLVSV